jgi:myo-inositol-1(or 4)-monophosphatase
MSDALEFALDTAKKAGQRLCEYRDRRHTVRYKSSDIDPVTEADVASERLIVDAIRARFPDHRILSEEGLGNVGEAAAEIPYLWLVDPLDGTVNYAHRYPFWGVSLALAEYGRAVLAATYDPLRDELFWAQQGQGAWHNGERMQVSRVAQLHQALVATGFAYKRATLFDNNLAEFCAVMPTVQGVRRAGAAVLDLAHLADGRLDGYWEMHLNPWDWAAGWLFVEEAGGMMTDMDGAAWSLSTTHTVASNGFLHEDLLALLKQARQTR